MVALVRRPAESGGESTWDPYAGTYDRDAIEAADAVVNVAGSPTVGNPHSKKWARELRESRVATTRTLATAIADSGRKPAFLAGNADLDAGMTYEPYLSSVRAKPEAGKIIATTLDYPMVMDTFGCTPKFLAENPKADKGLADAYFEALELIKADPKKSFETMAADVKQSGDAFEASQKNLRWQDREANQKFFAGEHAQFSKEAADLLLEIGIIKALPDMSKLADTRFLK